MISKLLKIRVSVTWIKYLGVEKKHSIVWDFGDKLYGEIKTLIVWGIVQGYSVRFLQVLTIIWIDDS